MNVEDNELENFLNEKEHIVLSVEGSSSSGDMWKKIRISGKSQVDKSAGMIIYTSFNSYVLNYGLVLNLSLQTNISMIVKCKKTALDSVTQIV